jgi:hypothetical protein
MSVDCLDRLEIAAREAQESASLRVVEDSARSAQQAAEEGARGAFEAFKNFQESVVRPGGEAENVSRQATENATQAAHDHGRFTAEAIRLHTEEAVRQAREAAELSGEPARRAADEAAWHMTAVARHERDSEGIWESLAGLFRELLGWMPSRAAEPLKVQEPATSVKTTQLEPSENAKQFLANLEKIKSSGELEYKLTLKLDGLENHEKKTFEYMGVPITRPAAATNCTTFLAEGYGGTLAGGKDRTLTYEDRLTLHRMWVGSPEYGFENGGGPVSALVKSGRGVEIKSIQEIIPGDIIQSRRKTDGEGHTVAVWKVHRDENGVVVGFTSIEATEYGKGAIQHRHYDVRGDKIVNSGSLNGTIFIGRIL